MKIFSYIYYRVTRFYKQFKEGDEYFLMGIIIVSILQFFNLVVVLAFLSRYFDIIKKIFFSVKYENNKIYLLLIVTALLIYNYIKYTKFLNYKQLDEIWKFKSNLEYKRSNLYTIVYFFASILFLILSSKFILSKI